MILLHIKYWINRILHYTEITIEENRRVFFDPPREKTKAIILNEKYKSMIV